MTKKISLALVCGGQSAEHQVSLVSAKNVLAAIDPQKYEVILIGITKSGQWQKLDPSQLLTASYHQTIKDKPHQKSVTLVSASASIQPDTKHPSNLESVDVVFPLLHGPMGEDGTIQGLLKLANLPFVGADVLGSAIGMDKDVMKRLLNQAGLPIAKFLVFSTHQRHNLNFDSIQAELGLPLFIKPANLGSSVGITKVHNRKEFDQAITTAFSFDSKVIIEEYIEGAEVECAVLGNHQPTASLPGRVIPTHEFYDYNAKYLDKEGATIEIPAKLSPTLTQQIQQLSIKVFQTLCCSGMARVDCFVTPDNRVLINEINTIPGFTQISMYPKLWAASGLTYPQLIDQLIQLALGRHQAESQLNNQP